MKATPHSIALLDPIVSERIAAGEVVERPASIVKEALENALDAGASEIKVHLKDGGRELIEVVDNGHGMRSEDLELSVLRHATSKIRSVEDLENLHTLGFRGEALPSMVASSEVHLISRALDSREAYEILANAQNPRPKAKAVTFGTFNGFDHGTCLRAGSLFSQMPGRLKFLKSARAEIAAVREWIEKLALTRPDVGFTLMVDDEEFLRLRPLSAADRTENEKKRILELFADGQDFPVVHQTFKSLELALSLRLYWIQGLSVAQSRKLMTAVNGRVLRDRLIQHALLSPFRQHLLPGQFPALALFMELDPSLLDVNIHPTKTEVRFLENQKIFRAVETLTQELIHRHGVIAVAGNALDGAKASQSFSNPTQFQTHYQARPAFDSDQLSGLGTLLQAARPPERTQELFTKSHPLTQARFAGQVFSTYWLFETSGELIAVDQHAAHERIRYEKLKTAVLSKTPDSQSLLMPLSIKVSKSDARTVLARLNLLQTMGFELEAFAEDAVLFRAIPSYWGNHDLETRLRNLLDRVLSMDPSELSPSEKQSLDETLFEKLASEACRSAIKAGDLVDEYEVKALVEELFECTNPWNCPHGRPTLLKIPQARFEEWFQRRI